jgi:beta-phosphoglucomutase-like phosphatase (HAD superfamily)
MQAAAAEAKAVEEQRRKQQLQKKKGRTKTDKERAAAGKAAQEAAEVERRQREEEERVLKEAEVKKKRQEALLALRKQVRQSCLCVLGDVALLSCWSCVQEALRRCASHRTGLPACGNFLLPWETPCSLHAAQHQAYIETSRFASSFDYAV